MPFDDHASNLAIDNRITEPNSTGTVPEAKFDFEKRPGGIELISRVVFASNRNAIEQFVNNNPVPSVPPGKIEMFGSSFAGMPIVHDLRVQTQTDAIVFINDWKPGSGSLNVATELIIADSLSDFSATELARLAKILVKDAWDKVVDKLVGNWKP